jgi:hypothetical protein
LGIITGEQHQSSLEKRREFNPLGYGLDVGAVLGLPNNKLVHTTRRYDEPFNDPGPSSPHQS